MAILQEENITKLHSACQQKLENVTLHAYTL